MTEAYREFVLRGRADWQAVVATVKSAAPTMASAGRPMRVILVDDGVDRTEEQVRFYWVAVIEPIAEQAVVAGCRFTKLAQAHEGAVPATEGTSPAGRPSSAGRTIDRPRRDHCRRDGALHQ